MMPWENIIVFFVFFGFSQEISFTCGGMWLAGNRLL